MSCHCGVIGYEAILSEWLLYLLLYGKRNKPIHFQSLVTQRTSLHELAFPSGFSLPLCNEVQNKTFDCAGEPFSWKTVHRRFDVLLVSHVVYEGLWWWCGITRLRDCNLGWESMSFAIPLMWKVLGRISPILFYNAINLR